jgi:hypothetical protein
MLLRIDTKAMAAERLKVEVRKAAGSAVEFTCVAGP